MKKKLRVVQINGFRGLLLTFFIISCLIAGFIAFPAFLTMNGWNYLALRTGSFHTITFWGGLLLWAIIAFSFYLFNKRRFILSFNARQELSEDELNSVISRIKNHTIDPYAMMQHDLNKKEKKQEENENQLSEINSNNDN